ncbi:MAG: heme exporter protein CcmB [Balneolaceae bacterium]
MKRAFLAVFKKDLTLELRTKYALNTILAFTASALLLILFTLRAQQLDPMPKSGLIWIIILFAAMTGMSRSFVQETEQKTWDLLRLHSSPFDVFTGKLLFNFLFLLILNIVTFSFYILLMDLIITNLFYLIVAVFFGALGLSSVTTMASAMISQADRKGAVFSVLCIPLLVPLLLILTRITRIALVDGSQPAVTNDIMALIGYCGVTITAGILLFDYIWND